MRIIFMGTPEFALPTFNALLKQENCHLVAVYTQPPRRKNRGQHIHKNPVHVRAEEEKIPVYTPLSLKGEAEAFQFQLLDADLAIVVAYGLILPQSILKTPKMGCWNIHGSLLPRWRGAAPIQYSLLEGDVQTGITLMQMDAGMDTGAIIETKNCPLHDKETFLRVHDDLAVLGAELCIHVLRKAIDGQPISTMEQDSSQATYAPKIHKQSLNFERPAVVLDRMVRAMNPYPGTYMDMEGVPVKVLQASWRATLKEAPTMTCFVRNHGIEIMCGDGAVFVPEVLQRPGGRPLPVYDFLQGFKSPKHWVNENCSVFLSLLLLH